MADEEVIEQVEVGEAPEVEETGETAEAVEANVTEAAPDTFEVEIGGAGDDGGAPDWVKELRKANREKDKELRELRAKLQGDVAKPALRPKPTAEDHDYDTEAFAADLEKWFDEKREQDARENEQRSLQEKIDQRWQAKLSTYDEGKQKLGATDFEEAEATVIDIFATPFPGIAVEDARMGVVKQSSKDPATLIYALGKNPAKAKELAAIEDPAEFAFALGELSAKMKVKRAGAPAPERKIGSTAPGVGGAIDNTLERLREEAAKTGDYTKVLAYKRQKA